MSTPEGRAGDWHLTRRQEQLVGLIRQGKANKVIAYGLSLTTGTVKEYLFRLYQKVRVSNRTELAILGLRPGLRELNDDPRPLHPRKVFDQAKPAELRVAGMRENCSSALQRDQPRAICSASSGS